MRPFLVLISFGTYTLASAWTFTFIRLSAL
jgi:hypothetical protein